MAPKAWRTDELLLMMQEVDLPTLLALDRELHRLLEQKQAEQLRTGQAMAREEFCRQYPHVAVDPDLFALVGIHPANSVEEDKALIREQISRRCMR